MIEKLKNVIKNKKNASKILFSVVVLGLVLGISLVGIRSIPKVSGSCYGGICTGDGDTVYRFYNVRNGAHFYTASVAERDNVNARWGYIYKYEGIAWVFNNDSAPIYRFYNLKNGTHFYTTSAAERDNVNARWGYIYKYEGIAWYNTSGATVYRFYMPITGAHFYTASAAERDNVNARWGNIYRYEGTAWQQ